MAETSYVYTGQSKVHVRTLLREIDGVKLPAPKKVRRSRGGDLSIDVDPAYSPADKAALDGVVADHSGEALAALKVRRYAEIDARTRGLLEAGSFAFNGKVFGLDAEAREVWMGLKQATDANLIQPSGGNPQTVGCLDNDTLDLTSQADVNGLYAAGLAAFKTLRESSRDLKKSIFDATARSGVDAVVDSR